MDTGAEMHRQMMDLAADASAELHPDLVKWVEDGDWGPMLRSPLVYQIPLSMPGLANKAYEYKKKRIKEALRDHDWHLYVFLHERAYRLRALLDVTGRDDGDEPLPLASWLGHEQWQTMMQLVADVWVDSENIQQVMDEWRALLLEPGDEVYPGLWLGTESERAEFDALPDSILAYRGGAVGDWSWTTSITTAQFFANKWGAGRAVRHAMIPKHDVFGYFTRRGESELLVRYTEERKHLVYPDRFPETREED